MNINTTYLLTGAAGFLGINICTQLIERGEHIRAFVLKGDPARKYLPAEVEVFEGDLCSAEDCEAFFNIPEGSQSVCIHCASIGHHRPGLQREADRRQCGRHREYACRRQAPPGMQEVRVRFLHRCYS